MKKGERDDMNEKRKLFIKDNLINQVLYQDIGEFDKICV